MTRFRFGVPEQHRSFVEGLAGLEQDQFESLASGFSDLVDQPFQPPQGLARVAAQTVPGWTDSDGRTLIRALFGMLAAMFSHSVPAEEFAESISGSSDLELSEDQRSVLNVRLVSLLTTPVIQASAKAVDVATENVRNFHIARVISQLRPVFRDDPTQSPLGGVVLHELHINSLTDDGDETYVVTLDTSDLELLKDVIERAIAKGVSLQNWLAEVGFSQFEVDALLEGD